MKNWVRNNKGFLAFLVLFGVFRTAVADWNPIPSASMHPNLLEGDVVFVNRLAFDLKVPLTDVVARAHRASRSAATSSRSLSPRGRHAADQARGRRCRATRVEMRDKRLYVNGEARRLRDLGRSRSIRSAGPASRRCSWPRPGTADARRAIQLLPRRARAARHFGAAHRAGRSLPDAGR